VKESEKRDKQLSSELRNESLRLLSIITEQLADAIITTGLDFRITYTNKAFQSLYGYSREEVLGMTPDFLNADYHSEKVQNNIYNTVSSGEVWIGQVRNRRKDGSTFDCGMVIMPLRDEEGNIFAYTGTQRDITERKKQDELLQEREGRYRSLVESTEDSIYLVDRNCKYLFMNRKHLSRMGLSNEQYTELSYADLHRPEDTKWFTENINDIVLTGKSKQHEYKSRRDGKYFLQTLSPVKDKDNNVTAVTIISKEITDLKQLEEKLRTMSFTDELTGLNNRRGFFILAGQQLKFAWRERRRVYLISADIDNLKAINDELGHQTGDQAITEIADILRKTFRESDIVARIGGDEFMVLVMDAPDNGIETYTSRLKANVDTHNATSERPYELSLSVGLALCSPELPCSIDELISRADKLMYEDKKERKS
jgi:diguanylate cyclase (GGDEF)-like protein/PAS domain S-box-containing protein